MGASDSKIVFKQGIFRLSEERHIPASDPYWTSLPESSEDIFSLFTPTDIRRTRDQALENIETLLLVLTSRLFSLRYHPSFPNAEFAPEKDALNCIRLLTRVIPYLHEKESLASWEECFFWGSRRKRTRKAIIAHEVLFDGAHGDDSQNDREIFENTKPLAEELIDTLVDFMFFSDLTIPCQSQDQAKVSYGIWQSGVGCNYAVATTKEYENNRCEILRLLLALAGKSIYTAPGVLPTQGIRALTYLCTCQDKQAVLSVLCSLLNTTLKYNPASWRVPYNALVFKDSKQILTTYCLQFMLALLIYPMPETTSSQKNFFRHFLGRLHRRQDFQFMADGMSRILSQPLQEKSSYLPGSQSSLNFAPETLMLFWELTQCNKRFRAFVLDTDRAHDFTILILFYATEYKCEDSKQGIVRMCAFLLQSLSVETAFGHAMNKRFEGQESLPASIRFSDFRGSYANFLIQSIYNLILTSHSRLSAVYPALLAVINNLSPYVKGLSSATSSQLMQLFSFMSSPSFLLANESNHTLLHSLLDSLNCMLENTGRRNPGLLLAVSRNRRRFLALRAFTLEGGKEEIEKRKERKKEMETLADSHNTLSTRSSVDGSKDTKQSAAHPVAVNQGSSIEDEMFAIGEDEDDSDEEAQTTPAPSSTSDTASQLSSTINVEDAVPFQDRAMSEKARGKMPAGGYSTSGRDIRSSPSMRSSATNTHAGDFEPSVDWIDTWLPELPLHTILTLIQQISSLGPQAVGKDIRASELVRQLQDVGRSADQSSAPRIQFFEWSHLALAWYESLLWGLIFTSEMQLAKGSMGIWSGTTVKLFRVQESAPEGPSFTSPRGAVDAVGSNIVSRIGQINLCGNSLSASITSPTRPNSWKEV